MKSLSEKQWCVWAKIAAMLLLFATTFSVSQLSPRDESMMRERRRLSSVDPKSVVMKQENDSQLRYIVFGGRNAYSYRMDSKNPSPAYPTLLSTSTLNLIENRDLPVEYPALCLNSLIGNKTFDVFVIEYSHVIDGSPAGIATLATRIRNRFPDSIILFIRLWYPIQFTYVPKKWELRRWMAENSVFQLSNEKTKEKLKGTSVIDWSFHDEAQILSQIDPIVESVGGHVWELPRPSNIPDALIQYGELFDEDFLHLSQSGQKYIANEIQQVIEGISRAMKTSKHIDVTIPWQQIDQCHSWYGNAIKMNLPYENMAIQKFDRDFNKWALECSRKSDTARCHISIRNEMNVMADVWLQYMATGPRRVYRDYEAYLGAQSSVIIEPTMLGHPFSMHVQRMVRVGLIYPGTENSIFLKPIKGSKGKRLKVTGVVLSTVQL